MFSSENYVYRKEVDWSVLSGAITLPLENQVVFSRTMDHFLYRGESKEIKIVLEGKAYPAQVRNVNFNDKWNRTHDAVQIRYAKEGALAEALKRCFAKSYRVILEERNVREKNDRRMIRLPEGSKEYLAIYTTEYDDTYIFEVITADEVNALDNAILAIPEHVVEDYFNHDETATVLERLALHKIRKLNRKIGDNLKQIYEYRCQICGCKIGEEYGTNVVESHHIEYFIHSHNNDAQNQLIVCPNHHRIIHNADPVFDRSQKLFVYANGYQEPLKLNKHIG